MATAGQILAKIKKIDVLLSAQAAIEDTASDYVKSQRDQLFQGLKKDGTYQPDYSPVSVRKYGKPAGPIKLYHTGDYYRGLKIDVQGEKISVFSIDEKNDFLEGQYHPLGLGLQARIDYIRKLRPVFIKYIRDYLS